ncbi:MAG: large subunit ribosomal protein L14e [Candidatus Woesearchaeota archaeon]|nr:large subunit ribosomal protein L14e [Candidatus Woesearchaeota archaeon]
MFEVGRVVMKIAGRDAGKIGVVIKVIDDKFVMIDGFTRRKKVNIKHLVPLKKTINIKEEAKREEILPLLEPLIKK